MKNIFGVIVIGLFLMSGVTRSQNLTVTADVNARVTGTPDDPTVTVDWAIHCQPTTGNTTYGWSGLELDNVHGTDNKPEAMRVMSGALGPEAGATKNSGQTVFKGDLGGTDAMVSFYGVFCHDGQRNSSLIKQNQQLFIPPSFKLVFMADLVHKKEYQPGSPVPVGAALLPQFQIGYHPGWGGFAQLFLHVAGADLTCVARDGRIIHGSCTRLLKEEDGGDQLIEPLVATPHKPGRITYWLELPSFGVLSVPVEVDVVGPDGKIVPDDFKMPTPKDPPKLPPNTGTPPVPSKPPIKPPQE